LTLKWILLRASQREDATRRLHHLLEEAIIVEVTTIGDTVDHQEDVDQNQATGETIGVADVATILGHCLGLHTEEKGDQGVEAGMKNEENDAHPGHQMILLDAQGKFNIHVSN
jgi:hypothetical protein